MPITTVTYAAAHNLHGRAYSLDENYLGKFVEWVRKEHPLHEQVLVYTTVAMIVIGSVLLFPIGIPLLLALYNEYDLQTIQSKINESDNQIYDLFGGKEKIDRIPMRRIPNLNWDTFESRRPNSMGERIEQTKDMFERPGFLLRIVDLRTKRVFEQAIYRKYMYDPTWDYSRGSASVFHGKHLDGQDQARLQLILTGRHRHFALR